jgi:polyhydroxyalkanoate synthesis regulator phasin
MIDLVGRLLQEANHCKEHGAAEISMILREAASLIKELERAEAGAQRKVTELKQQVSDLKASRDHFASLSQRQQPAGRSLWNRQGYNDV